MRAASSTRPQVVSSPRRTWTESSRSRPDRGRQQLLQRLLGQVASPRPRWRGPGAGAGSFAAALERLQHRGHQAARERRGQAVDGLLLAVEEGGGVGADVVLVAERRRRRWTRSAPSLPDLRVAHARGQGDGVAAGLGLRRRPPSRPLKPDRAARRSAGARPRRGRRRRCAPGRRRSGRACSSSSITFCVIFWSRPGLPVASLKRGTPILLMVGSTTVPASDQRVAAAGETASDQPSSRRAGRPLHFTTTLTRRPGTTTIFTISLPAHVLGHLRLGQGAPRASSSSSRLARPR